MRTRRPVAVLVTVVVLLAGVAAAPRPAAAVDACGGVGTMGTGPFFFYPGFAVVPAAGPVAMALPVCAVGPFAAAGTIGGWCGYMWGSAATPAHFFVFVAVGGVMVVTGGGTGVLNVVPNVPAGESCVSGADDFLLTGAVTLVP